MHPTPVWETGPTGPFDRWPTGEGFERFYGLLGGDTDQYDPSMFAGTMPVTTPDDPAYHLSVDITDRAIAYAREQKTMTPDKPFFVYLNGAIVAQGGRFAGWTLYLDDCVPAYCRNRVDHEYYHVTAADALTPGRHAVCFGFDYDGRGPGKGGAGRLLVDVAVIAEGRIENTCGYMYTPDGLDIGHDTGAHTIDTNRSPGDVCIATIRNVPLAVAPRADHDPERLAQAVHARQ